VINEEKEYIMKKAIALFLILTLTIISFSSCRKALPKEMPDDFSFSICWGLGSNTYDSVTGELHSPTGTVSCFLSDEELQSVYKILRDLKLHRYGDEISPYTFLSGDPCADVYITVSADGFDKTVTCRSVMRYKGLTPKTDRYLKAIKKITEILTATDEWKSLPPDTTEYM
jgi:hypothetical protein